MRITSGQFKNRKLFVPEGKMVRPTSDRMRQSLFNILRHPRWDTNFDLTGKTVMDLFCGSGSLGLEALSNGAEKCFFIDQDVKAITNNTGFVAEEQFKIIQGNAMRIPNHVKGIDLVFMDPPYNQNLITPTLDAILRQDILNDNAVLIIEAEKGLKFEHDFELLDMRSQSQSNLHFLRYNTAVK